jgi:type I restriction enzyme R subunit
MTPEEKARQEIDAQLTASGWIVQTKDKLNLAASCGVVVCEPSFATGKPDYALSVDGCTHQFISEQPYKLLDELNEVFAA